ncbi:hypothetical protein [Secundilactobacillus similis]|uniref:hypothetical protein n=1 Tax=Secundilactobacillus similis TaxID=414682 RepID=UPI001CDA8804|nr:hypothetical protein [Secundilactobacillus similis]
MKVKIIYTSLTGNTKEAVDVLSDALTDKAPTLKHLTVMMASKWPTSLPMPMRT